MIKLIERQNIAADLKAAKSHHQLGALLTELAQKELSGQMLAFINAEIETLNAIPDVDKNLAKAIKAAETKIITKMEKETKIVPKNYYRKLWLLLGMSVFGLPMGVAFGAIIGNMGLLALGLPIGMAIGTAVGTGMDKKALAEGRQLAFEVIH